MGLLLSHISCQAHVIWFCWQVQTNFSQLYGCQKHFVALGWTSECQEMLAASDKLDLQCNLLSGCITLPCFLADQLPYVLQHNSPVM